MLQFYIYWINVSAHTKSTIGKLCFVLKSLSLITFLTMGISSDYGREARCPSYDQEKIDVKIAWIRIGLAKLHHRIGLQAQDLFCKTPVGKMLQYGTCMFHATLHGSVARFCAMLHFVTI